MSQILVSGSLAYDRIMDFPGLFKDHFVADKLHNINVSFQVADLSEQFGGTAGNVAYSLALLGEEPRIIGTVGTDFVRYRTWMEKFGIATESIRTFPDKPTSAAFIITDHADNQIAAFHLGAGGEAYGGKVETDHIALAMVSAGCVPDMVFLPERYRKDKVRFIFDPGQAIPALSDEQLRGGISGAEAVIGNDYEIGLILQKTGMTEREILEHVQTLVITLGEQGARIITRKEEIQVPAVPVENAVDPTGAGDAYCAGFIKGLLAGLSLETTGKFASAVASYAVESYGTQMHHFTIPEVAERYQNAYGDELPKL